MISDRSRILSFYIFFSVRITFLIKYRTHKVICNHTVNFPFLWDFSVRLGLISTTSIKNRFVKHGQKWWQTTISIRSWSSRLYSLASVRSRGITARKIHFPKGKILIETELMMSSHYFCGSAIYIVKHTQLFIESFKIVKRRITHQNRKEQWKHGTLRESRKTL